MTIPRRITVFENYPNFIWVLSHDPLGETTNLAEVPDAHWGTARSKNRAVDAAKRQVTWLRVHSRTWDHDVVHEEIVH